MQLDFSGLIVLFGFLSVLVASLTIKYQQENKPKDLDW
ncbi:hypothetical protein ASZ90_001247 [hydrocarbon metagenome]|uniref:Uncharacterized protein n=1 Tax=hydrocarbon metagenome TaxID=938273 RepID=A0A0W8G709_9ZZZZ